MPRRVSYHQPSYKASLRAHTTGLLQFPELSDAATSVRTASDDPEERRERGQALVDALNRSLGLPPCLLVVADRRQVARRTTRVISRTYGYYRCVLRSGAVTGARIRIYHKTAVREQPIAPGVFYDTLVHEWNHHYDFTALHLAKSYHTATFYQRIAHTKAVLAGEPLSLAPAKPL